MNIEKQKEYLVIGGVYDDAINLIQYNNIMLGDW